MFTIAIETAILFCFIRGSKQLHSHGGDFSKLGWQINFTTLIKVNMGTLKFMKRMPTFVQHGLYIPGCVCMVHENKWTMSHMQTETISSRRFVFAAFQIKQILLHHDLEILSKHCVDLLENS